MIDAFSPELGSLPYVDLTHRDDNRYITNDIQTKRELLANQFQPRWRLRVIPVGVAVSLLFWIMTINIIG